MSKTRHVNTRFWDDGFISDLASLEKLMFLYVLTNPLTDLCGAYEITMKRIVHDTGIREDKVRQIFEKFESAGKIIYRDGWMIVRNFAKHQVSNPNVSKGIQRSLSCCPDWVKESLSKPLKEGRTLTLTSRENLDSVRQPKPSGSTLPPLKEIHTGKVLSGVLSTLGLKKLGPGAEREWIQYADLAFDNGFTAEEFIECFAELNKKHNYTIRAEYVTDRLPAFVKSKRPKETLPTTEQKIAESDAHRAILRPAPKPIEVETVS